MVLIHTSIHPLHQRGRFGVGLSLDQPVEELHSIVEGDVATEMGMGQK